MKESFAANKEQGEPLDGPKLYLNIVHHERVLPPLTQQKDFADPNDDANWRIIPIVFTVPLKRRNLANIECWHFDAHVNTCVVKRMRSHKDRFNAIWHFIMMRFQHHIRTQFTIHKQSIKLSKTKKYKNPLNNSQSVRKFILPKEHDKDYFAQSKKKFEKEMELLKQK